MIKNVCFTGCLLLLLTFVSCVRDGEEECPEGSVRLRVFAERFQNRSEDPLSDREPIFGSRVNHLRYYIYQDGVLNDSSIVNTFTRAISDSYVLDLPNLPFGDYKVVLIANSTKTALSGDPSLVDNLLVTFPGCKDTEDYFATVFDFSVNSAESKEYNVGLSRLHGVVRYTFKNLPEDATDVEVIMENVSNEKWITGKYGKACKADLRYAMIPVTRASEDYVMGTFPTLTDERSTLHVNLYRTSEEKAWITQMVSDTLTVTRNQLLDVLLTYNDGKFDCEIVLDNSWDGSSSGGQVGIE